MYGGKVNLRVWGWGGGASVGSDKRKSKSCPLLVPASTVVCKKMPDVSSLSLQPSRKTLIGSKVCSPVGPISSSITKKSIVIFLLLHLPKFLGDTSKTIHSCKKKHNVTLTTIILSHLY